MLLLLSFLLLVWVQSIQLTFNMERFVPISSRKYESQLLSLKLDDVKHVKNTKWNLFKWHGLTLMKDPMTLTIYQQLLQDIKPKTIIEFGSYEGGSALWINDILSTLYNDFIIHTFDIDKENYKVNNKNIIFHHVDNYKIKDYFILNKNIFKNLQHPILVIEDSHANVREVLYEVDKFLVSGDYVVVEDSIDLQKNSITKLFAIEKKYLVDTKYCDFWGYNNTYNLNGFLIKVDNIN